MPTNKNEAVSKVPESHADPESFRDISASLGGLISLKTDFDPDISSNKRQVNTVIIFESII